MTKTSGTPQFKPQDTFATNYTKNQHWVATNCFKNQHKDDLTDNLIPQQQVFVQALQLKYHSHSSSPVPAAGVAASNLRLLERQPHIEDMAQVWSLRSDLQTCAQTLCL
jgi:hypothetical protein